MGPIDGNRADKLDYIRTMLAELREMALSVDSQMLSYLIEVAYLEANDQRDDKLKSSGQAGTRPHRQGAVPAIPSGRVRARS